MLSLQEVKKISGGRLESIFAAADLESDGQTASRNTLYFVPEREVHLANPVVQSEVLEGTSGLTVRLSSNVLAPDICISFGDLPAKLSGNYFDLAAERTSLDHSPELFKG